MITIVNPRSHFVRIAGAVPGLAALLAAMVFTAGPASAHARLEATSPKDGSSLTATPPEVMLQFNESIQKDLSQVTVTSDSKDATDGKLQVEGSSVYQPLKTSLKAGSYKVVYKVVSADGHPVSGTFTFAYDPPEGDSGADADPSATTPSATSESATPSQESSSGSAADPSSTTAPSDGETAAEEPGDTSAATASSSPDADAQDSDAQDSDEGTSGWLLPSIAVLVLIAGAAIGLFMKNRRNHPDDEEITLDDERK